MRRVILTLAVALVVLTSAAPASAAEADFNDYTIDAPARIAVDLRMFGGETCPSGSAVEATLTWAGTGDGSTGQARQAVHLEASTYEFVSDTHVRASFVLGEDTPRLVTRLRFLCDGDVRLDDSDFARVTGSLELESTSVQQGETFTVAGTMPAGTVCTSSASAWLHRNADGTVTSQVRLTVDGTEVSADLEVPSDLPIGAYNVIARCGESWLSQDLKVALRQSKVALPAASPSAAPDASAEPSPSDDPTTTETVEPEAEASGEPTDVTSQAAVDDASSETTAGQDADGAVDDSGGVGVLVIALGGLVVLLIAVVAFLLGQRKSA